MSLRLQVGQNLLIGGIDLSPIGEIASDHIYVTNLVVQIVSKAGLKKPFGARLLYVL